MLTPTPALLQSVRRAFRKYGFSGLSMVDMARECGFTRRSLYNYFSSKEDALRTVIRLGNADEIRRGFAAGEHVREDGGDAVAILASIMNTRYGDTRREVESSPHSVELNAIAFMLCRDVMIDSAIAFQRDLAALVARMAEDGYLRLQPGFTPEAIAQTLANGARGVNQALPPPQPGELEMRYQQMCRAVLFGAAVELPNGGVGGPESV